MTMFVVGPSRAVMATPEPEVSLFSIGKLLLERTVLAFQRAGVAIPARQFVYMASVPADCPQLVVMISGWAQNPAPEGPTMCDPNRWFGNFTIGLARNTPALPKRGSQPPSAESMEQAARIASDDAEVFLSLVTSLGEVDGVDVRIGAPQGGMQIVELDVSLPSTIIF